MSSRSDNLGSITSAELANLVKRYPAWLLAGALSRSDAWWHHVEQVGRGQESAKLARLYVSRASAGRDVIATMLARAAKAPDRDAALDAMAPVILVFGDHPLSRGDPVRWIRGGPQEGDDEPRRPPSKQRKRDYDAWETWRLGAEMVARRGAGLCLKCGLPLSSDARDTGRVYCRVHQGLPEADQRYHRRAMSTVLRKAVFGVTDTESDDFDE